jgi:hypothetical protein
MHDAGPGRQGPASTLVSALKPWTGQRDGGPAYHSMIMNS